LPLPLSSRSLSALGLLRRDVGRIVKNGFNLLCFGLALLIAGSASAHGGGGGEGSSAGLPVPEISHGEMAVIADYRGRIMDLAAGAVDTNEPFRRVLLLSLGSDARQRDG
jgi:hypothetical protein